MESSNTNTNVKVVSIDPPICNSNYRNKIYKVYVYTKKDKFERVTIANPHMSDDRVDQIIQYSYVCSDSDVRLWLISVDEDIIFNVSRSVSNALLILYVEVKLNN